MRFLEFMRVFQAGGVVVRENRDALDRFGMVAGGV